MSQDRLIPRFIMHRIIVPPAGGKKEWWHTARKLRSIPTNSSIEHVCIVGVVLTGPQKTLQYTESTDKAVERLQNIAEDVSIFPEPLVISEGPLEEHGYDLEAVDEG